MDGERGGRLAARDRGWAERLVARRFNKQQKISAHRRAEPVFTGRRRYTVMLQLLKV